MRWKVRWVFDLTWGQRRGRSRSRGSRQLMLWGSVHSRDFYPVALVTGLHPVTLMQGPHRKDGLLGVLRGPALIPVVRARGWTAVQGRSQKWNPGSSSSCF